MTSPLEDNRVYHGAAHTCGEKCEVKKTKADLPEVPNNVSQSLKDQAGRKSVTL